MPRHNGFTLIEITVVMIISGVLLALAIPTYMGFMQQGAAIGAEHNLLAIYSAQKNYFLSNGGYCTTTTTTPANCGSSLSNLNNYLATLNQPNPTSTSLGITDSSFTYTCTNPNNDNNQTFSCTATNNTGINLKLVITNGQIALPGASGTLNPLCQADNNSLCPSS
jgi:prepilin-type N-terminal cleavage/methylation domain-containing protein